MMNFPTPTASKPSLLSPQQLDNLFHEFGHAMHSMIGKSTVAQGAKLHSLLCLNFDITPSNC